MSQHKKLITGIKVTKKYLAKKGGKVGQARQNIPMLNEKVIENETKKY